MNLREDLPHFPIYFLTEVNMNSYQKPIEHLANRIRENYPDINSNIFGYREYALGEEAVYVDSPEYLCEQGGKFIIYSQIRRYISTSPTRNMILNGIKSMVKDSVENKHTIFFVPYPCLHIIVKLVSRETFRGPVEIVAVPFSPVSPFELKEDPLSTSKPLLRRLFVQTIEDLEKDWRYVQRFPIAIPINREIVAQAKYMDCAEDNEMYKVPKLPYFIFNNNTSKRTIESIRRFIKEDFHLEGIEDIL